MRIRAVAGWAFMATLCMFAGACNKNGVDPNLPAITTQPVDTTVKAGSTATFTVAATGQGTLTYQWFVFAKAIKGATSPSFTTPILAPSDNGSFYFVLVTNAIGSTESNEVLLTVTAASTHTSSANTLGNANPSDVLTQHNDAGRTGQYLGETLLTPTNVNSTNFGKLGTLLTDGAVDAQPLYASGVTLPSGDVRNMLYAASEHGSVYGFDSTSGALIWQTGLAGANEQPADSGTCTSAPQERGITATPVIDRTSGPHGAIYVIANTKDSAGTVIQRIHALDISTGAELFSGPTLVQTSAQQNFDAAQYQPLAGLQLVNGKVYAAFGPTCGAATDSGWVMGFDAAGLSPSGTLYLAPAVGAGASGFTLDGISADSAGNLYVFDQTSFAYQARGLTSGLSLARGGSAFLKLSTENGVTLIDSSKTSSSRLVPMASAGVSGSAVVLPDFTDAAGKIWHLALGAGSDGDIYLLNRDSLGSNAVLSMPIVQSMVGAVSSTTVAPAVAYFGDYAYYASAGNSVKAFTLGDARLSTSAASQSTATIGAVGAQISISANDASGGILWMVDDATGILHAYNAANLSQETYNSTQAADSRDTLATTVSSASPTIAGGRVYIATKNGIVVFGHLK